jgi:hypothetical protein
MFFAFFMNCYHLKDWVQHDAAARPGIKEDDLKKAVEAYVGATESLMIARDLCNGVKHLVRKPSSFAGHTAWARSKGDIVTVQLIVHYTSIGGHQFENAIDLAKQAVEAWERFFAMTDAELLGIPKSTGKNNRP